MVKEESKTAAQDLLKLRKKSKAQDKRGYSLVASSTEGPIDELFQFIGSDPDKAVSSKPYKLVQFFIYGHPPPHRAADFQVQNMFFLDSLYHRFPIPPFFASPESSSIGGVDCSQLLCLDFMRVLALDVDSILKHDSLLGF